MSDAYKPCILVILDGWGIAPPSRGNAITSAKKPFFSKLLKTYPAISLESSGEVVGLTWGEMGNSEVGHLTLGAGRIIYQSLARINKSIVDGDFFNNTTLNSAAEHVKKHHSSLHLLGLVSNGGVHSHIDHLFALLDYCKKKNITRVYIHAVVDGRDTKKDEGVYFIRSLISKIKETGIGSIATLMGRMYAMDRDNHWQRTEKAYRAIVEGHAETSFDNPLTALETLYAQHMYDEEIPPVIIRHDSNPPLTVAENDAVIFFNFRPDRARQLTAAFTVPGLEKFKRKKFFSNLFFATFTEYDKNLPVDIVYPTIEINNTLSQIISEHEKKQLHIAETEKYAHVTYFFNGGKEAPFPNEDRILLPSPMVANYDLKPEMSAYELTNAVLKQLSKKIYDFIVLNFANADMVGHTGNFEATIKAVQTLDTCIELIVNAVLDKQGAAIITADHGNAEKKIDTETGDILKEHTKNPVPCIFISREWESKKSAFPRIENEDDLAALTSSGMLADVAPTLLTHLNIPIPKEMYGKNLL